MFPIAKVSCGKSFHFDVVAEGRPGWFVNQNGEVSMQNVPAVPSEQKRRRIRHASPPVTSPFRDSVPIDGILFPAPFSPSQRFRPNSRYSFPAPLPPFVNQNGEVSMQNFPAVPSEPKRRRIRHASPPVTSRIGSVL